ncbi:aspartic proteinase nepenthesin-2-like [Impatiens glandulifera]|uniref:aspartic proteinase nepenthesin-2-like n=1 Tax=Impatiens glandulifera TaxID=253017 RepID=UPI001FB0F163|nr:aspartic proteinase nepenthesin-2-like [Impatiens glandulifera]
MVSINVPWLLCLHLLVFFVGSVVNEEADGMSLPMFMYQDYSFKVKIGIGTFKNARYMMYDFKVDISSDFLWLECEGCTSCFTPPILDASPFPLNSSSSGTRTNNSINVKDGPYYSIKYHDGTSSTGYLARETFSFNSTSYMSYFFNQYTFTSNNILFGCGIENVLGRINNGGRKVIFLSVPGVMGLGWGPLSFVEQINPVSKGMFSYCLPIVFNKTVVKNYLRFGNDIPLNKGNIISSTSLKRNMKGQEYHLEMVGISFNDQRLNISNDLFRLKNNGVGGGGGGCIINLKEPLSLIIQPAYEALKYVVIQYFSKIPELLRVDKLELPFPFDRDQLCYRNNSHKPFDHIKFPTITFHFSGEQANLVLNKETIFTSFRLRPFLHMYFCLAMLPNPSTTIIGVYQQIDHRFVYDRNKKELLFYPENCLENS